MVEEPVEGVRGLARDALGALVEGIGGYAVVGVGEERGGGEEGGDCGGGESEEGGARVGLRSDRRERVAVIGKWWRGSLGIL